MEPKVELTGVDIAAITRELTSYEGMKVDKAYLYPKDLLRLKGRDFDRGRVEILVSVGDRKRIHVSDPQRIPQAPDRPPNFAKMLRNRLSGADLLSVSQHEFDRISTLTFDRGDGETTLVIELFGDGNIVVLDEDRSVIDSLETVRLQSRTVAPGEPYEYPESRVNPFTMGVDEFDALLRASSTDVVRTLATQLNLGGFYGEEICSRAGVEKERSIEDVTEADSTAIHATLSEFGDRLRNEDLEPRVYYDDDNPVDVAPLPLVERNELDAKEHDTFNEAVDVYFHELSVTDGTESSSSTAGPNFEEEISKRQRIIEQQETAIQEFETEAAELRRKAERMYEQYGLVQEILTTVESARADGLSWDEIHSTLQSGAQDGLEAAKSVTDVDATAGTVTIRLEGDTVELDPSVGVEQNANRLYEEAKRIEDKREGAQSALEETREELTEWKRRREKWHATDEPRGSAAGEIGDSVGQAVGDSSSKESADQRREANQTDWLSTDSVPIRTTDEWFERFRWFHTNDDFLVIGGRSADQNEELIGKYLEPGDRVFHTEAHGAPITILKATGPSEPNRDVEIPASSEREAAQFAVSYSSLWKEGLYAGDVYAVDHDQVSKTPESGEYLEKGGFAIRGDRTYYENTPVGVAVGIQCEPVTRVIGGPPSPIESRIATGIRVEPGRFAQADVAKRAYRIFRERFTDTRFVRNVASPDLIQHFLPPGTSRIVDEE